MQDVSDSVLEIVPPDPRHIPSKKRQSLALRELNKFLLRGEKCDSWESDYVQFIGLFDCENQQMLCPKCRKKTTLTRSDVICLAEKLSISPPTDIQDTMPCCGEEVSMVSIDFGPHIGFAQFGIQITNRIEELNAKQLKSLKNILDCDLTQIQVLNE